MIRVSDIQMVGNELAYLTDAVAQRELSWHGAYVRKFEEAFASHVGSSHALSCSSGTAALHLALLALGIGPGDEVILPVLTYVATANAVAYCGATPIFVDVHPATWCLDIDAVDRAITPRTRAVMPVQLYGHWPDMDLLEHIAQRRNLAIVEDAAEGLNATWRGRHAGTIGTIGAFSFYANKTITSGEGGMIVVNDANPYLRNRLRLYREQGADTSIHQYYHPVVGYNYRMTNLQAAVGLAQLESMVHFSRQRRQVITFYERHLEQFERQTSRPYSQASDWMFTILLPPGAEVVAVRKLMYERGVETRPVFVPMHQLPMYANGQSYPVAEKIASRGLSLPTHAGLTATDVAQVVAVLTDALKEALV